MIREYMNHKNMTVYRLARVSGVPYATLSDLCNGRTRLEKCNAETVYRISRALNVPMEDLVAPLLVERTSFENYKSAVCHRVKEQGDVGFILNTLESGEIRRLFNRGWYPEALYLLAMLDYLCRENKVPICTDFDDLRGSKLEREVFPASILARYAVQHDLKILKKARADAIPEFARFNIIENEVRDVI